MSAAQVGPQEDQQILDVARDLWRRLNGRGSMIKVSWVEKVGLRELWPDYVWVTRGNVKLSFRMKGKFTPNEWRPLIASSLVYFGILNRKIRRAMRISFILVLPAFFIPYIGSSLFATIYFVLALALLLSFTPVWIGILRYVKRLWLRADREAAILVGRETFMESLTKIQAMNLDATKKHRGFVRPTIEERIQNLLSLQGSSPSTFLNQVGN